LDTFQQLEHLKNLQKYWSDNSVSITVYYKEQEIEKIKNWLRENLSEIKTISFLKYSEHGFKQAPIEKITKEQYEEGIKKIKPIDIDSVFQDFNLESFECDGGACPVK